MSDLRSPFDLKQLDDRSPAGGYQQALQMANMENFPRLSKRNSSGLNSLNDIRNSLKQKADDSSRPQSCLDRSVSRFEEEPPDMQSSNSSNQMQVVSVLHKDNGVPDQFGTSEFSINTDQMPSRISYGPDHNKKVSNLFSFSSSLLRTKPENFAAEIQIEPHSGDSNGS